MNVKKGPNSARDSVSEGMLSVSATTVAIAGGTCSGKSTLASALQERLGQSNCAILRMDNFYRPQTAEHLLSGLANLDQPGAFDIDCFRAAFDSLRKGYNAVVPVYDRRTMQIHNGAVIEARRTLVIEGLFVLSDQRICDFLTLAVFLDIDPSVQRSRRLKRDTEENNMNRESSLLLFARDVTPGFREHILPTRARADLTLSGTEEIAIMVEKVLLRLKNVK